MHRLIVISRRRLRCARCGEHAFIGSPSNRVPVTGVQISGKLMACEDCLQWWADTHRCEQAQAAA